MKNNKKPTKNVKMIIDWIKLIGASGVGIVAVLGIIISGWRSWKKREYVPRIKAIIEGHLECRSSASILNIQVGVENVGQTLIKIKPAGTALRIFSATMGNVKYQDKWEHIGTYDIFKGQEIESGEPPCIEPFLVAVSNDKNRIYIIEICIFVGKREWNKTEFVKW